MSFGQRPDASREVCRVGVKRAVHEVGVAAEEMVITLSERLEPPKGGKFLAVHTLNALNDLTVIDVVMK